MSSAADAGTRQDPALLRYVTQNIAGLHGLSRVAFGAYMTILVKIAHIYPKAWSTLDGCDRGWAQQGKFVGTAHKSGAGWIGCNYQRNHRQKKCEPPSSFRNAAVRKSKITGDPWTRFALGWREKSMAVPQQGQSCHARLRFLSNQQV